MNKKFLITSHSELSSFLNSTTTMVLWPFNFFLNVIFIEKSVQEIVKGNSNKHLKFIE